jgi:Fe-coproporphyrin III synthase
MPWSEFLRVWFLTAGLLVVHPCQDLPDHRELPFLQLQSFAAVHPELFVTDVAAYTRLREQLHSASLSIDVVLDEDLSEGAPTVCAPVGSGLREIERIEADSRGALTMSCKAVGKDSHAFWYDKSTHRIIHRPSATDELALAVPDVVYAHV